MLVKKVGIIFLIVVVFFANFQQIILLSLYQFNKEYFTKNFCENIDKPEKKCNGQCYINKNIAAQNEEKNGKDFSFKWKEVEIFFDVIAIQIVDKICLQFSANKYISYSSIIILGVHSKIAHPPQA